MKKILKSVISLAMAVACVGGASLYAGLQGDPASAETVTYEAVNGYQYNVEKPFPGSPDSFMAWIKLPDTSLGGTIMGNWINSDGSNKTSNSVNWEIDAFGRFSFAWDDQQIQHSFIESASLFDNEWHHVSLVRTDEAFTYYLDGEVESVYNTASEGIVSNSTMNIGVDKRHWLESKIPLEGYIRQVTVYEGAVSQEQIKADMQNQAITAGDTLCDATLMGNWYFGEEWTQRVVENTLEGGAICNLHTSNKYVGADYSFGDYDYTFVVVPDIQIMTRYNPSRLKNMTKWLADNKEALNIEFVTFLGDLADTGKDETEYINAAAGMDNLNNVIPYCFVPGNHDYNDNFASRDTTYFNKHFSVSKHSMLPGFGGVYEQGKMENSYYLFQAGDVDYLVINLEYHPRMSALRWAGRVIEQYPEHRVIIETHDYVTPQGQFVQTVSAGFDVTCSQQMFDGLVSKYPNVFLALGGHHPYEDIVKRTDIGENGNRILSMLVDGQGTYYKGNNAQDMLLLCHVNESKKTINFVYYSPEKGKVWNIQNQFQYSFADQANPTIGA